jgi:hypothetical protein
VESLQQVVRGRVRQVGKWGIGAHPAGVGSGVAVAEALVIARDRQGERVLTVAQGDQTRLTTLESLLDDHALPSPPPDAAIASSGRRRPAPATGRPPALTTCVRRRRGRRPKSMAVAIREGA